MSTDKRDELIAAGVLDADGNRIPRCPVCGQTLPEGSWLLEGATVETVAAEASTP